MTPDSASDDLADEPADDGAESGSVHTASAAGDDKPLVLRAVSGDEDALIELLQQNVPAIRASLHGKIDARWRSCLGVDDVLQEAFARAFMDIERFKYSGPASFRGWLTTLARHSMLDAIKGLQADKRGGNRQRISPEDSYCGLYDTVMAESTSASVRAQRAELQRILGEAIDQLPDGYRHIVTMYDLNGQSVDAVAQSAGCSSGAVYMRRARAHNMLQRILGSPSLLL